MNHTVSPPVALRASVLAAALAVAGCFGAAITFTGTSTQVAAAETAHSAD
jgi:hypothetical protein